MNQQRAKAALVPFVREMGAKYLRAIRLIEDPDSLNQGNYGVCAMSCAVRSMLEHDRQKFVDLVGSLYLGSDFGASVLGDPETKGREPPPGYEIGAAAGYRPTFGALLGQLSPLSEEMMKSERTYYGFELDFLLSRSLGLLLELVDQDQYRQQLMFSERFNKTFTAEPGTEFTLFTLEPSYATELDAGRMTPTLAKGLQDRQYWVQHQCGFGIDTVGAEVAVEKPGAAWWILYKVGDDDVVLRLQSSGPVGAVTATTKADGLLYGRGHLAVAKDGMLSLLRTVASFAKADVGRADPTLAVRQVNDVLRTTRPFVYAGINGFAEFVEARRGEARRDATARTFDSEPTPEPALYGIAPPEFAHWVAVTGAIGDRGTHYAVPVWTWQEKFTVSVRKDLMDKYFIRFIVGTVR